MVRRLISIPAVLVALPVWGLTFPAWLIGSIALDVVTRLWRLPTLRLFIFTGVYLVHEWVGIIAGVRLWVTGRFGRRLDLEAHRKVQAWWAHSLLAWAGRLLNVRFVIEESPPFPARDFIVLSRHASMVDAVVPADLITHDARRFVHYVIKRELQWDPNLDLFGGRLGNHFVARGEDADRESAAIEHMARGGQPDAGYVIFPEGTYATPRTRSRVLASLRRNGDGDLLARADALGTLLPPKPAGSLALLTGRPDADVLVLGHVGLEGVAELRGLRRRLPLRSPVIVRWWLHQRHDLPSGEPELTEWLFDRWQELDRWVTARG